MVCYPFGVYWGQLDSKEFFRVSCVFRGYYFVRSLITVAVVCVEVAVAIALIHWNKWTTPFGFLVGPELMIFTVSILAKKILQDSEKNGGTIVPPAVQIQQEIDKEKAAEEAEEK